MKNLILILSAVFLFSCTKEHDLTVTNTPAGYFTLSFQVDNDIDCTYHLQSSVDGQHFENISSFNTDPTANGNYNIDLQLRPQEQVRLQILNNQDRSITTSNVLVAN